MKVLITGGHTQIPIDKVRVISNIFKGRTAINIANYLELLRPNRRSAGSSIVDTIKILGNPEMSEDLTNPMSMTSYKSYDELYELMKKEVTTGNYDVIIHSAAVSDYYVSGVVIEPGGEYIDSSKKVSSSHDKLFLELKKTRKIVDDIRSLWQFKGCLVKFKLQVGIPDNELLDIARKSRTDSQADVIVANCLEWSKERAYLITKDSEYSVARDELPKAIYSEIIK